LTLTVENEMKTWGERVSEWGLAAHLAVVLCPGPYRPNRI
jgi:hypothetical protein